jgi:alpha-tubulin suppressor-like RCC1 family protein
LIPIEEKVIVVSAGGSHSGFVTETSKLMMCGNNRKGQLGVQADEFEYLSPQIIVEEDVISVACGETHTLLLTSDGGVFGSGDNFMYQLGCDPRVIP